MLDNIRPGICDTQLDPLMIHAWIYECRTLLACRDCPFMLMPTCTPALSLDAFVHGLHGVFGGKNQGVEVERRFGKT